MIDDGVINPADESRAYQSLLRMFQNEVKATEKIESGRVSVALSNPVATAQPSTFTL